MRTLAGASCTHTFVETVFGQFHQRISQPPLAEAQVTDAVALCEWFERSAKRGPTHRVEETGDGDGPVLHRHELQLAGVDLVELRSEERARVGGVAHVGAILAKAIDQVSLGLTQQWLLVESRVAGRLGNGLGGTREEGEMGKADLTVVYRLAAPWQAIDLVANANRRSGRVTGHMAALANPRDRAHVPVVHPLLACREVRGEGGKRQLEPGTCSAQRDDLLPECVGVHAALDAGEQPVHSSLNRGHGPVHRLTTHICIIEHLFVHVKRATESSGFPCE